MKEQFATYEIALKLKEIGFDEECLAGFLPEFELNDCGMNWNKKDLNDINNLNCSTPLWQQVIDWFREKHNIWINIDTTPIKFYQDEILQPVKFQFVIEDLENRDIDYLFHSADKELFYLNPNEALEKAILKTIELCQK